MQLTFILHYRIHGFLRKKLSLRKAFQSYDELKIKLEFPEGSILVPLFFQIYSNDFSDGLTSIPKLFGDNTSAFFIVRDVTLANNLSSDLINLVKRTISPVNTARYLDK